jgi:HAE1 family hydrophobic/amphiphilic exporter-1
MMVVLRDEVNPLTAEKRIRETLAQVPLGPDYSYKVGDEVENIVKTRWEMVRATIIAIILIYLVLVAATESLVRPVVIMTAVPFAVGGSVMALSLTGNTVSMPVYTGVLALCGLVVNMNIMLAFAINDRLRAGADEETAVLEGTQRRLRPILMTTLTGILGGAPMLLDRGAGSTLWAPFAGTLASGLAASTVFALILTPSVYLALIRAKRHVRRIISLVPRGN